jgi:hypothetical protein
MYPAYRPGRPGFKKVSSLGQTDDRLARTGECIERLGCYFYRKSRIKNNKLTATTPGLHQAAKSPQFEFLN